MVTQERIDNLTSIVLLIDGTLSDLTEGIESTSRLARSAEAAALTALTQFQGNLDLVGDVLDGMNNRVSNHLTALDAGFGEAAEELSSFSAAAREALPTGEISGELQALIGKTETCRDEILERLDTVNEELQQAREVYSEALDEANEQIGTLLETTQATFAETIQSLDETLSEEFLEPMQSAVSDFVSATSDAIAKQIEQLLSEYFERLASDVALALQAAINTLKDYLEDLVEQLVTQITDDSAQSGQVRSTLENAINSLEPVTDMLEEVFTAFKSLARSVGVSL
ncbi:hypothetical protein [Roseibium album]|uniref:Phage-related protein n=1 Tax=Roseibium album TaxID=311410 RepID=A0A0M6ZYD6_9HYPH|nr:hypothetical protein [Roseibium album]CTQ58466.1 Phage-related protein [Roseibium album]CTQ66544.1 Phage-related protein [Roseibium album]CTQ71644.1 Phage-related protein [Roseibium album]